jgi:hypothetical protein
VNLPVHLGHLKSTRAQGATNWWGRLDAKDDSEKTRAERTRRAIDLSGASDR